MTGGRHHLCLFNLRTLLHHSFTSLLLSQDSIFDSFREVCASKKTPLDPAKRHHKNREQDSTLIHAQITNTHGLKHASPPRGFRMFWLNKHKLVYALRWWSAVSRDSKETFFCCKNDFSGRQTSVLNHKPLKSLVAESFFLLSVSLSTSSKSPNTICRFAQLRD